MHSANRNVCRTMRFDRFNERYGDTLLRWGLALLATGAAAPRRFRNVVQY